MTAVTALAIVCSWMSVKLYEARVQRRAVLALERVAGTLVVYDYEDRAQGAGLPNANPPGPKLLRRLIGDDCFRTVVSVSYITPRGQPLRKAEAIEAVKNLPDLLAFCMVRYHSDVDYFAAYEFTDQDVNTLTQLRKMRVLSLTGATLKDDQLRYLCELADLESLDLRHVPITDASVEYLLRMKKLELLLIGGTNITEAGKQRLRERLPGCEVEDSRVPG